MAKGVWKIYCYVCEQVADGPPHGTTCLACEELGYKYCTSCEQILPLEAFYARPDTGKRMTKCIKCYTSARNKCAVEQRKDSVYIQRRNEQSAACKRRKYATEEGRAKEILRCHERRASIQGDATPQDWQDALDYFGHTCAYCGSTGQLTVDHIIPISRFGANKRYNIIPACPHCNSSKSDHEILDWYLKQPFYAVERLLKIHSWFKSEQ